MRQSLPAPPTRGDPDVRAGAGRRRAAAASVTQQPPAGHRRRGPHPAGPRPVGPAGPRDRGRRSRSRRSPCRTSRSSSSRCPDGLEVTLWAASPLLRNPTNMDIDRDGRIWVAEGVRYRSHHARQPEGDKIVVLEDTDERRQGRQDLDLRPGAGPDRAARRRGHRQQDRGLAAARPDRLHRRRSQPGVRSGGRQARGAADRLPGHQPRPLAALGHRRSGRQVDLQPRQHRRRCSPTSPARRSASFGAYRDGPVGPFKIPHDQTSSPASRATTATSTSAASPSA